MKKALALFLLLVLCNLVFAYSEARAGGAKKKIADIKSLFEKKGESHDADVHESEGAAPVALERDPAHKNPNRTPPLGACLMDSGRNGDVIICNGAQTNAKAAEHAEAPAHPAHSSGH